MDLWTERSNNQNWIFFNFQINSNDDTLNGQAYERIDFIANGIKKKKNNNKIK